MLTSMGHPYRNRMRHPGWSYRVGTFHVVICCEGGKHFFGEIEKGRLVATPIGAAVAGEWERLAAEFDLRLDERQVMPNHFHGIVEMNGVASLPEFVGRFKGKVTRFARSFRRDPHVDVWQRGFWDTRIRTDDQLETCREYIRNNPLVWMFGRDFLSENRVMPWEWKEWMEELTRGL